MKYVARTVVKTEHFQQASRINNSKPLSLGKQNNCQNAADEILSEQILKPC
jgi:hypothetical protein